MRRERWGGSPAGCSFSPRSFLSQPLAHLPQLLCHSVVASSGAHLLQRAVGKVASAEGLDALLQGAVQRGLGARLGVQEEELGERKHEQLLPQAQAATQLRVDDTWE